MCKELSHSQGTREVLKHNQAVPETAASDTHPGPGSQKPVCLRRGLKTAGRKPRAKEPHSGIHQAEQVWIWVHLGRAGGGQEPPVSVLLI